MEFSQEQQLAFNKYAQGRNIFITGPGGSGKSALIKLIYQDALSKNKNVQVCALTGCAAVLLNCKAKTLHSWAGIGIGNLACNNINSNGLTSSNSNNSNSKPGSRPIRSGNRSTATTGADDTG